MSTLYLGPENNPPEEDTSHWPYPTAEDGVPAGDDTTNVPTEDYGKILET